MIILLIESFPVLKFITLMELAENTNGYMNVTVNKIVRLPSIEHN